METMERRYRMTRVRAGDYLLPSNDEQTLWRISSYGEDGSAQYQDERGRWHKVLGTFWQIARRPMPSHDFAVTDDFLDAWDDWRECGIGFKTRREAVEAALRH